MRPIDGLDKLSALLRSRIASTQAGTGPRIATPGAPVARPSLPRRPIAALEQELRTRVRQLRQQPGPPDAVSRAVIGTLLAWELNDALHNEPKFHVLVQQVQRHIRNDPTLDSAFQRIIEQLE